MSDLKKVAKGQAFSPKADTWNAFIDAAQFVRQRQTAMTSSVIPTNRQNTIVKIRNKSGEDQNQLSVLGIDDLAIKPDNEETIQRFRTEQPVFDCKRIADIDETKQHEMKFVVLVDPIKNNECGQAIVTGITPIQIQFLDDKHSYASPTPDDPTMLFSSNDGVCRILWKQDGVGVKWALIDFPVNDFPRVRFKNNTGSTLWEGDACEVESAGPDPWTLNVVKPTGDSLLNVLPYSGLDLLAGEIGTVHIGEVMRFAVDSASSISPGDFVGTQSGYFELTKNRFGFLVLATESTDDGDFAYVRYSGLPPVIKAVADSSGDTIDVKHCDSDGNTEGDTFTLDIIPEDES